MTAIQNRYEFVYLFDVKNGNPNGDPDAGNLPRLDPETSKGLVSDVCLKRKVRNYVQMEKEGETKFAIYVQENAILNEKHREAYLDVRKGDKDVRTAKKLSPKSDEEANSLRKFMCDNFFDIRCFGAVLSTGINCGQVRGPVQVAFASSIDPIMPLEISITRMAATSEKEKKQREESADDERQDNRTMGRKHIVPYGLYRAHGFVSAKLAARTGFSNDDLDLLWKSLVNMFDHDRSAARGEMTARRLIVFKHASELGNAPAHTLFELVDVQRKTENGTDEPARDFGNYTVSFAKDKLPQGVEALELI
ncbi:MAG: type I-C CRISPR-associated protein Cas7/Csd2 [Rhodospirillales bacterium]|nr:type I-C CRISPR-associated protein Cas7/Csd2 [Rhodospirillales bacterium]